VKTKAGSRETRLIAAILMLWMFCQSPLFGQPADSLEQDTAKFHKGRLTGVLVAQGTLYVASVTGLYFAWYKDYPQSTFHLFNDGNEWLQVDKCGHAITAYYISRIGYSSYRWSGVSEKKATWYGGLLGFAYLLNIEILDGFSSEWGFSPGDLTANTLGSLIFIGQQLAWHEQRISLKYSFHQTQYAQYRPDLMGDNLILNMIKDYNGHSYWISGNIASFLPMGSKFPKWLNIAIGYGAEGMTGAAGNMSDHSGQPMPQFPRYRRFLLSVDIDLTRIPTRSKALKGIFTVLSFIKIPAPALEYNTLGQFKVYPFYY
jgi:hypothetical protein